MCGIAGVLLLAGSGRSPRRAAEARRAVARMLDAPSLRRRGPDHGASAEVRASDGTLLAVLAATRLGVTDRANPAANLPMRGRGGSLAVTYNGEVYNHRALREELASGYPFATRSDTEVWLAGWARWGVDVLGRVEGMYALALVDGDARRALLAVDHAGQKPLRWHLDRAAERIVFASDVETALASGLVPFDLDALALQEWAVERYVRGPRTHLRGLRGLGAGTSLSVDLAGPATAPAPRPHHALPAGGRPRPSLAATADLLAERVRAAHCDVVAGCEEPAAHLLSGGVDSSGLVALAHADGRPVAAYTLSFRDAAGRPMPHGEAAAAARFVGDLSARSGRAVPCREVPLTAAEHASLIERWSRVSPELLYGRDATFLLHLITRVRDEGRRVVVTGCGPDEVFDGYGYGGALRDAARRGGSQAAAHHRASRGADAPTLDALLGGGLAAVARRIAARVARVVDGLPPGLTPTQTAQAINWQTRSVYECLKSDVAASAVGVEARKPYYARPVVALALRIPDAWTRHGGQGKGLLRLAFERAGVLPAAVARREKLAFPSPAWLSGHAPWRRWAADVLAGDRVLGAAAGVDLRVAARLLASSTTDVPLVEQLCCGCVILERQREVAARARAAARADR